MGDRPSPQHSVDRRNNAGDYTPDNCRWATKAEQAQNSRINVVNAHTVPEMRRRHANGESIRAVATAFGLGYHTAYAILKERTWKP
jgi:DNA invertase Pin-like site-specific DNA recombinase